jgi:cysteinyl-tRNA synthetase
MLRIYNTLTRKIAAFKPLKGKEVRAYACGPTVYNYPHIGNLRAFLFADLLRRWLEKGGLKVKQVMNLTDVDDKTIKRSQSEGIALKELTEKFAQDFFADTKSLKIKPAEVYPRATEHIAEMLDLIQKLMDAELAYKSEDGIYFSISKFKPYGKLSKIKLNAEKPGKFSRVASDEYEKAELRDFALWKFWKPEDGEVKWPSPWGEGRPGWHIECSAMSMKYLGPTFDLHTGGVDLVFPHHENEIAQSMGATKKPFVGCWAHSEHLLVDGQKMSKSLGNIITLREVAEKGFTPLALRYLLLSGHYRTQINFTWEALQQAQDAVDKLNDFADKLHFLGDKVPKDVKNKSVVQDIKDAIAAFKYYLDEDLDTPQALASFYEAVSAANKAIDSGKADKELLKEVQSLLDLFNSVFDVIELPERLIEEEELEMIGERERLRKYKKYKEADLVRANLKQRRILLEDTPYGVRWKRARK